MFSLRTLSTAWCWVLIIFWATLSLSFASEPQLSVGDRLSVFSDKAYRKDGGRYFEAVGNVVIISQKDTVYGEVASLDQESMLARVEGNVRVVMQDMTLHGSHLEYNLVTGGATIRNARIITPTFNLVANELIRISPDEYLAKEAEFSTCHDCPESWSVYGNTIRVKVNQYAQIQHGLAKVKGVHVLYLPYIVIPISGQRKTGLLIPTLSNRLGEGLAFEQPVFVALGPHRDMTVSPTFWAKRGYGGDLQYRHRFNNLSWVEFNSRTLSDTIYVPGGSNTEQSGREFFRYFTEIETHQQWSPNLTSHFRYTGARDLDVVRDHPQFTDPRSISSDFGFRGFVNWRQKYFSTGVESHYLRNQLVADPMEFDRSYVQVMPRLTLSSVPYSLVQSSIPGLQHITVGFDSSFTRFRQVNEDNEFNLRNADRFSARPYLVWNFLTKGPFSFRSRYMLDQQSYVFPGPAERGFGKNAGLVRSEVSFTMDRIFGLAYEERIPLKHVSEEDLQRLRERREQGLTPLRETRRQSRLIGEVPAFESELVRESINQVHRSYRHGQEFKLIHHFIASENEYGNQNFRNQITNNYRGWFDWEDAIRSQEFLFGSDVIRTIIPPQNTVEFQWNNSLIRKTPKNFSYLADNQYLRDNFSYQKIGYFNLSQGFLVGEERTGDYRDRLTRLMIDAGYSADRWNVGMREFYFHAENQNIFNLNFNRRFDHLNIFSAYNYNSFAQTGLNTLSIGGQVRPTDVLGFAMVKEMNLATNTDIRTVYSVDIMPNNNCWILNLNFRESIVDQRFSFNILFNFGDESFQRYRNNYFGVVRL
jgi:LPS-assembly protein